MLQGGGLRVGPRANANPPDMTRAIAFLRDQSPQDLPFSEVSRRGGEGARGERPAMIIIRIVLNGLIMAAEIAAVIAVAYAGYSYPFIFAAVTAALSFALGLKLEADRLRNEMVFYFGRASNMRLLLVPVVGGLEALMKGVLAGLAAILTFSGTNSDRLFWVAAAFGLTVYAGASILRLLSINLEAYPARWGYFRLGPPLGLMFSGLLVLAGVYGLVPKTSVGDIGWKMVWELPERPGVAEVSELVFQLKQTFDDFIVRLLEMFMSPELAQLTGVVLSVNVLAGFVASLYAAIIASVVRRAEDLKP